MSTPTRRRLRRILGVLMAGAGTALLAASPALAAAEVRTETDLFGFDVEADASPVSVRMFDDFVPIPTDPGEPQLEVTVSYSGATLGTGPSGRAVASSVWPGAALGDGFGAVTGDESQEYPIRASARYPGRGEEDWRAQSGVEGVERLGMHAEARGLDVTARSEGGGVPAAASPVVAYGQVRSASTATVQDGRALARGVASIAQVRLLEGLIVLDDVTTELTATSDGTAAATDGRTTVGGITVFGMPVRLTDRGVEVVPPDEGAGDGDEDRDAGPLQPLQDLVDPVNEALQTLTDDLVADGLEEVLGIHIEALGQEEVLEGPVAERAAHGLRVTVDLAVLRGYLDPLLDVVPIGQLLDGIPEDGDGNVQQLKGLVYELLGLGPKIQFVVGSAFVAASAAPPFELPEPPPLPDPPPAPPAASAPPVTTGTTTSPSTGTDVALPPPTASTGTSEVPAASVAPPAPPPTATVAPPAPTGPPIAPFRGVPAAAVGVSLLLGAAPTFGMRSLRDAALGLRADAAGARALPDLRGGA